MRSLNPVLRRTLLVGLLGAAALVLALAPGASAAPMAAGRVQRLALPGTVTATIVRDLDGDGRRDLLLAASRPADQVAVGTPRRVLALFLQREDGSFGEKGEPDQLFAPDARAVLFSVVDLLAPAGVEIVEVSPDRVTARRFHPRRRRYDLRRLPVSDESRSFFLAARTDRIAYWDGAVDLGWKPANGATQGLVLPEDSGYVLFEPPAAAGASEPVTRRPIDGGPNARSRVRSSSGVVVEIRRRLDRAFPFALDGGERRETVRIGDRLLRPGGPGDALRPDHLPRAPNPPGAGKAGKSHVLYRDLDGDGIPDPVAFYRIGLGSDEDLLSGLEKGEGNCVVRLYNGTTEPNAPEEAGGDEDDDDRSPRRRRRDRDRDDDDEPKGAPRPGATLGGILRLGALGNRLSFADVDGDGTLDVVVSTLSKGMLASLAESFLDRATFDVRAYRYDAERRQLQTRPFAETEVTVERDDALQRGVDIDCVRMGPDLDGDGRADVVVFDAGRVAAWRGRTEKSGLFGLFGEESHVFDDGEPLFEVALPARMETSPLILDVDGDGADDVVASAGDRVVVITGAGGAK